MTFSFSTLFGGELLGKKGPRPTDEALSGKSYVALYFSAHWCPPCRGFTPDLGKFYEANAAAKNFELVFVSSDKDEKSFTEYYGEQAAWLALPFKERDVKNALSKQYKVKGIPTLVILDGATGEVVTTEARSKVSEDPEAKEFPWKPPTPAEVLATLPPLQAKAGGDVPCASLAGKPLLLYFSAHWCPPCRGFTPKLVAFFTKLRAAHPNVNVVFVSSDKDESSFADYFGEMGPEWLALPFAARDIKEKLSETFGVSGIPSLVLLDGDGDVVTTAARALVEEGTIEGFPTSWAPQPFADLSKTVDCCGSDVNEIPALLVLVEALDNMDQAKAVDALKTLATKANDARPKGADPDLLYFYAKSGDGPVGQVRQLCGATDTAQATLIKLDIPDQGGFYIKSGLDSVDAAAIADFLANPGDRQQLKRG